MLGFLYAFASLLSFSLGKVLTKKPVDAFGEWTLLVWRYASSIIILLAIALFAGKIALSPSLYSWYALTVAIGATAIIAFFKSLKTGVASNSAVSSAFLLISIPLATILYGETLSQMQWLGAIAIVLGVSGLALLRNKSGLNAWSFIALVGWGAYFTLIKPIIQDSGTIGATFLLELGVGTLVIAYALVKRKKISMRTAAIKPMIVVGAFGVIGGLTYSAAIAEVGAALAAAISGGAPVVVAVLSFFMLREKLEKTNYAAIALVTLGLVALALGGS